MFPILVRIGPLTVHTYGLLLAVGVGLGLWFLYVQARKQGLDAPRIMDAAFYTIIVSLIGAKLILFFGSLSFYLENPRELFSLARSGGVFQGGLTFGVIFALWYFYKKKIPTWPTADIIGPALALGHGFGRIGCFSAGCCYGTECALPWSAVFNNAYGHQLTGIPLNIPLHPVQLYEAALNFLNFGILFWALKRKTYHGHVENNSGLGEDPALTVDPEIRDQSSQRIIPFMLSWNHKLFVKSPFPFSLQSLVRIDHSHAHRRGLPGQDHLGRLGRGGIFFTTKKHKQAQNRENQFFHVRPSGIPRFHRFFYPGSIPMSSCGRRLVTRIAGRL